MNKNPDIKNNPEEILNSLEGIQQAAPMPYLYTRIMARINRRASGWEKLASLISKPAIAFATIMLFLLINVAVLYHLSAKTSTSAQEESSLVSDNEYSLSVSSLYDINPEQNVISQK